MHSKHTTLFFLALNFFSLSASNNQNFALTKNQPVFGQQVLADLRCTQPCNQFPVQTPVIIDGEMPYSDGKGGMITVPIQIDIIYDIYGRPYLQRMRRVYTKQVRTVTKQTSLIEMTTSDVLVDVWDAIKKLAYAGAGSVVIIGKNVGPVVVSVTIEMLREISAITAEAITEMVLGVARGCNEAWRDYNVVPMLTAQKGGQRYVSQQPSELLFEELSDDEAHALAHLQVVKPSRIDEAP
jgi:hypothetical protein